MEQVGCNEDYRLACALVMVSRHSKARWCVWAWCCVATRGGGPRCGCWHPQLGFDVLFLAGEVISHHVRLVNDDYLLA